MTFSECLSPEALRVFAQDAFVYPLCLLRYFVPVVFFLCSLVRVFYNTVPVVLIKQNLRYSPSQRISIIRVNLDASYIMLNNLRQTTRVGHHNWAFRRHRLQSNYPKRLKQRRHHGNIRALLQLKQSFILHEPCEKHLALQTHASNYIRELLLHVTTTHNYEFSVNFFQNFWNSINQHVRSLLVNQSSNKKHNFLFRQREPASKLLQILLFNILVNLRVYAVRNHRQLVAGKPKSPLDMRNHVFATADYLPRFVRKPSFCFMNHFFRVRVGSFSPPNLGRVHCNQKWSSENMLQPYASGCHKPVMSVENINFIRHSSLNFWIRKKRAEIFRL